MAAWRLARQPDFFRPASQAGLEGSEAKIGPEQQTSGMNRNTRITRNARKIGDRRKVVVRLGQA